MSRFFKYLVIIVILFGAALFAGWKMLPGYIASSLSSKTGVGISIGDINFTLSSIEMDEFEVGNPPGSLLSKALSVDKTLLEVPLQRFFDKRVEIPHLYLKDIYLGLEFDSKKSKRGNWTTIMKNLSRAVDGAGKNSEREVLIKYLVLENLDIELAYRDTGEVKKLSKINRIELTNVSSKGGLPTAQIMNIIMKEALKDIFSRENLQNMLEDVLKKDSSYYDKYKSLF